MKSTPLTMVFSAYFLSIVFTAGPGFAQQDPFATRPPGDPLATNLDQSLHFEFPAGSDPVVLLDALVKCDEFPWSHWFGSTPLDRFVAGRKQDATGLVEYGKQQLSAAKSKSAVPHRASTTVPSQPSALSARQFFVLGTVARALVRRDDAMMFFENGIRANDSPADVAAMRDELAGMYGSFVTIGNVPFQKTATSSVQDAIRIHRLAIADRSEQNRGHRELHLIQLVRLHVELELIDEALKTARVLVQAKPNVSAEEIFGLPAFAINPKPGTTLHDFLNGLDRIKKTSTDR